MIYCIFAPSYLQKEVEGFFPYFPDDEVMGVMGLLEVSIQANSLV